MTTTTPTNTTLTHLDIAVDAGGVAVVTLDRRDEAINSLSPVLMDDFERLLDRLESDEDIRAVVLTSAKKDFLVGADVRWFGELTDPEAAEDAIKTGHALFARLEALHTEANKPVVAAIHGAALGGGCELALACSHRIATNHPSTQLGQPEVQLGVLPAGGGTQRLPRLVGVAQALDLMLTGKPVRASKAKKLGLVDEVVFPEQLLEVAKRRAVEWIGSERSKPALFGQVNPEGLQKLALETNPIGLGILFKQARQKTLAETKGNYPAAERILEAVRIGVHDGPAKGYAAEARFFGELVTSPQSEALRSIFFATRELAKDTTAYDGAEPRPVATVAVLGGGLMGAGIAAVSTIQAGSAVRIKEVDLGGVRRGLQYVAKVVGGRVDKRRMSAFEGEKAMLRVSGSADWSGFAGADLVIEAVFEDLELKRSMLREVEAIVGPETVFASNTSTIPITRIAEASTRPETVLGMHYFSPVEKMPLLEVIVTDRTAPRATATAVAYGQRQGKTVIVVNDGTGFYTSRIIAPYSNEALRLLEEGASIEAIDDALVAWGFPVGPLLLADEVGLDVGAKVSKIMVDAFGERMQGPEIMSRMGDRKGRKNGRGFYRYDEDGTRGGPDDSVYAELGLGPRRDVARAEIQDRVTLMMVNEAARCLEEGILGSARDGDIGAVMGLGFPPFRGGPFWYVDSEGAAGLVDRMTGLAVRHGDRFTPAPILQRAAEEGTRFRT